MARNKPHEVMSGEGWLVQFAAGIIPALVERGMSPEEIHRLGTSAGTEDMRRGVEAFCDAVAAPPLGERLEALVSDGRLWISDQFRTRIVRPALKNPQPAAKVGEPFPIPESGMADAKIREHLGDGHTFKAGEFLTFLVEGVENGSLPRGWNLYYVEADGAVFAVIARWSADVRQWDAGASELDDSPWLGGARAFPRVCS